MNIKNLIIVTLSICVELATMVGHYGYYGNYGYYGYYGNYYAYGLLILQQVAFCREDQLYNCILYL